MAFKYFSPFYMEWILHNFKLCILCLHLPAGKHNKSIHNNTVCKFHCRRDLMIAAIRCREKIYIYIYRYQYQLPTKWVVKYCRGGYRQKNPSSCIPAIYICFYFYCVLCVCAHCSDALSSCGSLKFHIVKLSNLTWGFY